MKRIFMRMFAAELSGQRVLLALLFTLGLTFVAPGLLGSPVLPCPVASVATYETLGQCTIEGFTFEDFTFSESQTGGATLLTPSQITVNPTFSTPNSVSFQFFGDFSSAADQTEEYIVQYELDPVLPQIVAQSIDLGPADPVTLIGQFCGNGSLVGAYVAGSPANCSGTNEAGIFPLNLAVTSTDGSPQTTPPAQFPLIATDVDTRLVLDLDGLSSTTYFGTNAELTGVPEPSTSLWLAPGMLALFWLRKKWLANAR
jgi:hypothetical protein